jgi:hypothetical protein
MKSNKSATALQTTAAGLALFLSPATGSLPLKETPALGVTNDRRTSGDRPAARRADRATVKRAAAASTTPAPSGSAIRTPSGAREDGITCGPSRHFRSAPKPAATKFRRWAERGVRRCRRHDRREADRLRVEVTSDKQQRLYFYNGSNLSVPGAARKLLRDGSCPADDPRARRHAHQQ